MSLHLWALTMIGIFYIGGMRFRAPYDPIIIVMAAEVYVLPLVLAVAWWRRRQTSSKLETNPSASGSKS